ncbi:hypothetical protein GGF31_008338 [Allomyces arbusculus]|nr:hypothetical protein GGF31_008338 [Allomyces arbusculus]
MSAAKVHTCCNGSAACTPTTCACPHHRLTQRRLSEEIDLHPRCLRDAENSNDAAARDALHHAEHCRDHADGCCNNKANASSGPCCGGACVCKAGEAPQPAPLSTESSVDDLHPKNVRDIENHGSDQQRAALHDLETAK